LALYDQIGGGYDITRRADPYITNRILRHSQPRAGQKYIDLACGSGNYTIALKAAGMDISGIDISWSMLDTARQKDPTTDWILGDAEALPLADNSVAGACCVLAVHHFDNLQEVFNEIARVVTGRLVIFTSTAEQMAGFWLNAYFPEMMKESSVRMPSKDRLQETLMTAGFQEIRWETYEVKEDLRDFFLYSGKHRPEMYLDPRIRLGISSFSSLAQPAEVERGYDRLEADIQSGRIKQVIESYANRRGDYLFVTGSKQSTPIIGNA
jgi:ubiquinone/menaquinone biosynthesis C-methylase UbiE